MNNSQEDSDYQDLEKIYSPAQNNTFSTNNSQKYKQQSRNSMSESGTVEYESKADSLKQENEKISQASLIKNEFYNFRNQNTDENIIEVDIDKANFKNGRINKVLTIEPDEKKSKESLEFSDNKENLRKQNQSNKLYDKLTRSLQSLDSSKKSTNNFGFNTKSITETDKDSLAYETGAFNQNDNSSLNEGFSFSKDFTKETIANDATTIDLEETMPSTNFQASQDLGKLKLLKDLLLTDETLVFEDKPSEHKNITKYFFNKTWQNSFILNEFYFTEKIF